MLIFLVNLYKCSSVHKGFSSLKDFAIRLCSRTQSVCMECNAMFSSPLMSPTNEHPPFVVHPLPISNSTGRRSSCPLNPIFILPSGNEKYIFKVSFLFRAIFLLKHFTLLNADYIFSYFRERYFSKKHPLMN